MPDKPIDAEYILTQDNDSHWYVIPASEELAWGLWLNIDEDDPRAWDVPSYAKQVGGSPSLVTFRGYTIR